MRRFQTIPIVIIIVVFIALPLLILVLRTPQVSTFLPIRQHASVSDKYSVENDVKGYTISLVDTSYLDYMTAKLDMFAPNAVVGPGFYTGKLANTRRQQISHITFALVDHVDIPISIVGNAPGLDCQGDYVLDGNTLVDRVVVGFQTIGKQPITDKYAWENSFLRCALNTLYYAKGVTDPSASYKDLVGIKLDIDKNIYSGIFVWPLRITQQSL